MKNDRTPDTESEAENTMVKVEKRTMEINET